MPETPLTPIEIGLTAAIVAVEGDEPAILVAGELAARAGGKDEPPGGKDEPHSARVAAACVRPIANPRCHRT